MVQTEPFSLFEGKLVQSGPHLYRDTFVYLLSIKIVLGQCFKDLLSKKYIFDTFVYPRTPEIYSRHFTWPY